MLQMCTVRTFRDSAWTGAAVDDRLRPNCSRPRSLLDFPVSGHSLSGRVARRERDQAGPCAECIVALAHDVPVGTVDRLAITGIALAAAVAISIMLGMVGIHIGR